MLRSAQTKLQRHWTLAMLRVIGRSASDTSELTRPVAWEGVVTGLAREQSAVKSAVAALASTQNPLRSDSTCRLLQVTLTPTLRRASTS